MKRLLLTTLLSFSLLSPLMASENSDANVPVGSESPNKKIKRSAEGTLFGDVGQRDVSAFLPSKAFEDSNSNALQGSESPNKKVKWSSEDFLLKGIDSIDRDLDGDIFFDSLLDLEFFEGAEGVYTFLPLRAIGPLVPLRATVDFRKAVANFYDSNGNSFGLPKDVVHYILSFIHDKRDRAALSLVSRGFCSLIDTRPVLSFPKLKNCNYAQKVFLFNLLRNKILLKGLIVDYTDLKNDEMRVLASICKNLEILEVSGRNELTGGGLKAIVMSNPNLTDLDLSNNTNLTDDVLISLKDSISNLKTLNLHGCTTITNQGLQALDKVFPNINVLYLDYCEKISDVGLHAIGRAFPNLTTLSVSSCPNITGGGLQNLAESCKSLTYLNLSRCGITDEGVQEFTAPMPFMTTLYLPGLNITPVVLTAILPRCPKLEELVLEDSSGLDDEALKVVADYGQELTYLNLAGCPGFSYEGFKAVLNSCKNLHNLDLSDCDGLELGDALLNLIAKRWPNLTHLGIYNSDGVTDDGLRAIAKGCPKLENIDISLCTNITSAGLEALAANRKNIIIQLSDGNDSVFEIEQLQKISAEYPSVNFW